MHEREHAQMGIHARHARVLHRGGEWPQPARGPPLHGVLAPERLVPVARLVVELQNRPAWDEHLGHLAAVAPAHGLSEWDHDVLRRTACRRDKR